MTPSEHEVRVLFFGAEPRDRARVRVAEELRDVESEIRKIPEKDRCFSLQSSLATRVKDIEPQVREYNPDIIHFSGHGAVGRGIVLQSDTGQGEEVSISSLARYLGEQARRTGRLKLVVLNLCHSAEQASDLLAEVGLVVAMRQVVSDSAAAAFSPSFYGYLAKRLSLRDAFDMAAASAALGPSSNKFKPLLLENTAEIAKSTFFPVMKPAPAGSEAETVLSPSPAPRRYGTPPSLSSGPFLGREREMAELGRLLHDGDPDGLKLAIRGPSGMGKTELVRRYIAMHHAEFEQILWVDLGAVSAHEGVARLLDPLGAQFEDSDPIAKQADRALLLMNDYRKRLLVFDGADDSFLNDPLLPLAKEGPRSSTSVVVTTTSNEGGRFKSLKLEPLDPQDQARLLLQRPRAKADEPSLKGLEQALHENTRLLLIASRIMKHRRETLGTTVARLRLLPPDQEQAVDERRPELAVQTVVEDTLELLASDHRVHRLARGLFLALGWCDPGGAGLELLAEVAVHQDKQLGLDLGLSSGNDEALLRRWAGPAADVLCELALVVRDERRIRADSAILEASRSMGDSPWKNAFLNVLSERALREYFKDEKRSEVTAQYHHARKSIDADNIKVQPGWLAIPLRLAEHLRASGDYKTAWDISSQTLNLSPPTDWRSAFLHLQGRILQRQEKLEEALTCLTESLKLREKAVTRTHDWYPFALEAATLNSIGEILSSQCRHREAKKCHEQALKLQDERKVKGDRRAITYNDLGMVCFKLGDLNEALRNLSLDLEIKIQTRGPDDRWTAFSHAGLARVWLARGDTTKALEHAHRAFEIRQKQLGPSHPKLAEAPEILAEVNHEVARRELQAALDTYEELYSSEHEKTVKVKTRLENLRWDPPEQKGP